MPYPSFSRCLRLLPILALPALGGCVAYPYQSDAAPGSYVAPAPAYVVPPPAVYVAPPVVVGGGWWGRPYYRPYYRHRHW